MNNIAIILAGGTGSRLEFNVPKQFLKIAGKTVIEHSVDAFEKNDKIDEIAIVIHESYISDIENMILENDWKKVKNVLKGGKERFESSLSAINAYRQFPDYNLIFHDAVRPMVSDRIINDVVTGLALYNAVGVAIPTTDTIIQMDEERRFIKNIPDRFYLQRAQTPQAFKVATIQRAYEIALQDANFQSSDDCGVVAKYLPDEKIFIVRGDESNLKLTHKEDFYLLEKLFQYQKKE
jgi:2-C-methyl-D-erythritol 4-phosphate cytidylyltransferase